MPLSRQGLWPSAGKSADVADFVICEKISIPSLPRGVCGYPDYVPAAGSGRAECVIRVAGYPFRVFREGIGKAAAIDPGVQMGTVGLGGCLELDAYLVTIRYGLGCIDLQHDICFSCPFVHVGVGSYRAGAFRADGDWLRVAPLGGESGCVFIQYAALAVDEENADGEVLLGGAPDVHVGHAGIVHFYNRAAGGSRRQIGFHVQRNISFVAGSNGNQETVGVGGHQFVNSCIEIGIAVMRSDGKSHADIDGARFVYRVGI